MSKIYIISAPSGSGKTTLVDLLLETDPQVLFSVSYTTRAPREAHEAGRKYMFVSRKEFLERAGRGEFIEHAEVHGNLYGTHRGVFDRAKAEGKDVVLDIDVQGARQLKEKIPQAISIFILAPSREELAKRLRFRSQDSEEVIERRLANAAGEIRDFGRYDYIVINEDRDAAFDRLHSIIKAERARRTNPEMEGRVSKILESFGQ
jgi:guanylate kinase